MAGKRKNNTAHARSIRKQKKEFRYKDLSPKQQKLLKIGAIAAAVLLIVLIVLYRTDNLPHLDGRLYFRNGALKNVSENDLVINRESGRYGEKGRYYIVGSIDGRPEGYVDYPEMISASDEYRQAFSYKPENPDESFISSVVIQGCLQDHEALIPHVLGESDETMRYSERIDGVSPEKQNVYHAGIRTSLTRNSENGYYYKYANAYVENGIDESCVMVQIAYKNAYKKNIPSDEMAMEDLVKFIDLVNVK
ncbi:MAG: hypothetical protein IKJ65_02530 [Clostridia bacterium]|nr:hypothetical protein [Clostridia bacterium]